MNGLEAIELMKQGKMVESDKHFPHFINLSTGTVLVWIAGNASPSTNFDINYEGYREYVPELKGWERVLTDETFYLVNAKGRVVRDIEDGMEMPKVIHSIANYFSTKEKAKEINFKQILFRKLQRFSDENGAEEIDWTHEGRHQWFISYDYDKCELVIDSHLTFRDFGQVYFVSYEVAQQALELFKDDLIKYFTHDWTKGE